MKLVERTQTLKMFVGGSWVDSVSGETFEALSPATGEVIATLPKGNREDARKAVEAADAARPKMASLGLFERAQLLHKVADAMGGRRGDRVLPDRRRRREAARDECHTFDEQGEAGLHPARAARGICRDHALE